MSKNIGNVILSDTDAITVVKTKQEYFGLHAVLRNEAKYVNELQKLLLMGKTCP